MSDARKCDECGILYHKYKALYYPKHFAKVTGEDGDTAAIQDGSYSVTVFGRGRRVPSGKPVSEMQHRDDWPVDLCQKCKAKVLRYIAKEITRKQ